MYKLLMCAALAAAIASPAQAQQFRKPEDAIKYRKAAFTLMGTHVGRLAGMVNNRVPYNAKTATDNAEIVAMLAQLPFSAFEPGTDKGNDTRAKAVIWTDNEKFRASAARMQEESVKLATAARSGNQDALKAAFGGLTKSCDACHDNYRQE